MFTIVVTAYDGTVSVNGLFRKQERADKIAALMQDPFSATWIDGADVTVHEIMTIGD